MAGERALANEDDMVGDVVVVEDVGGDARHNEEGVTCDERQPETNLVAACPQRPRGPLLVVLDVVSSVAFNDGRTTPG